MNARALSLVSSVALLALIALCVVWEGWLAPLRPGGSWMMLKALPLLPAVFGVLRGRRFGAGLLAFFTTFRPSSSGPEYFCSSACLR